jgi:hypothetical protein
MGRWVHRPNDSAGVLGKLERSCEELNPNTKPLAVEMRGSVKTNTDHENRGTPWRSIWMDTREWMVEMEGILAIACWT